MHKHSLICVLVTLLAALPSPASGDEKVPAAVEPSNEAVPADDRTTDEPKYESVVVSDPYAPAGLDERRTIRRVDLERQGARSVAEALERSPAVHATTGGRNERLFSIRGFDQRQTAVLVDGAPAFIAYDGQVDLGMLPPEMVESVSVSRGPGSLAAGPNALGPTVNIITRRPGTGPLIQGRLDGGGAGTWRGSAVHSHRVGDVAYTVYAGGEHSEGFPLSAGFTGTTLQAPGHRLNSDRASGFVGASALVESSPKREWRFQAAYVDAEKGVPPSTLDDTPRYWRFNLWRGLVAGASHASRGTVDLEQQAYVRVFDNRLDGYDDATYSTRKSARAFESWYRDRTAGLILKVRAPLPAIAGQLRSLVHVAFDHHDQGEGLASFQRALLTGSVACTSELTSRHTLTLGGQLDAEIPVDLPGELSTKPFAAGPLAALRYEPSRRLGFSASVTRRFRFPSLKERFSRALGTRLPNPDLRPESAWHFDLESSWRPHRALHIDASFYDAEITDLIDRVHLGGGTDQLQNISAARLAGAELSLRLRPSSWLRVEIGYAWLHARRLDSTSGVLAYRPAHKAVAGVVASPVSWLELSTFARVVGSQSFQNPTTLAWGTLGSFTVWDAGLQTTPYQGLSIIARATNLFDVSYQTEYGFPDPGRQLWIGVRAGLDPASPASR